MRLLQPFLLALTFLTRLPAPSGFTPGSLSLAQAAWAFPAVGLLTGTLAALGYNVLLGFGVSPTVAAWMTLGFLAWLTGGLHEDGLADMADGLAHGRDRERKLAIMRDSRIGSYGVLALIVILAIRANALAQVTECWQAIVTLAAAGAASRACMALLMRTCPMARSGGLAAGAGQPSQQQTFTAAAIGIGALLLTGHLRLTALCLAALGVTCLAMAALAKKHFGGITGDVLGATQQVSEALVLMMLSANLGN